MSRNRGIFLIFAAIAIALAALSVQEIRLSLLGVTVSRGNSDTILGLTLGLDLQGGTHLVYDVVPEGGGDPTPDDMEAVRKTINRRVNEFGVSEATVQELGTPPNRILVQIPGQPGASLNINFNGTIDGVSVVTKDSMEEFFQSELGRTNAMVVQEKDGSLTIHLDEIRSGSGSAGQSSLGEAEVWLPEIEKRFPATMLIRYAPQIVEDQTATDSDETTKTEVPLLKDVQAELSAAGFGDAKVTELTNGVYQVEIIGLKQGIVTTDQRVLSDDRIIRDRLAGLGSLESFATIGNILSYTVGGGVEEAKQLIGSTAKLEFRERICGSLSAPTGTAEWPPEGMTQSEWLMVRCDNPIYYTEQAANLESEDLVDAFAGTQPGIVRPVVNIVFSDEGGNEFFALTERIAENRDRLAIYLDGVELVSPGASEGITGGRAFIEGPDFTAERTRTIAIQLRAGALPADLHLIQERNVDATMGKDSLRRSLIAGSAGLVLLLIFMCLYYKIPGFISAVLLITYTISLLAIFKLIPVTLTLSGAAALILSLGFAVDANILIAERIKEELRTGRNLLTAVNLGFDRAWPSIRDGNLSTIITAVVLFWFGDRFGTSIMQGFALTLGIGVLLSMFTAFFASRVFLRLAARSKLRDHKNLFVPVKDIDTAVERAD